MEVFCNIKISGTGSVNSCLFFKDEITLRDKHIWCKDLLSIKLNGHVNNTK